MSKNIKYDKASKKMNRYFTIAKVFLAITPFIGYLYLSLRASSMSITLQEVLTKEPSVAIIFLMAMLNPYIAYLLDLMQKKLQQDEHQFACINMVLLLISQAIVMNSFYFMMLAIVFYKAIKFYDIEIFKTIKQFTIKQSLLLGGGSFIVMFFSSVCLFATLRLM